MSDIDKQRIAAVKTLAGLGYTWEGGVLWKPPLGAPPAFTPELSRALAVLAEIFTSADEAVGFTVRTPSMPYAVQGACIRPEEYVEVWRTIRNHLGLPT